MPAILSDFSATMPDHLPSFFTMDDPLLYTVNTSSKKDWLELQIGESFRLPKLPRQEPKFIKDFIISNNLKYVNPQFKFVDPNSHVGIEVEIENISYINPNIPICFWQITEDGSLRNHGKEFKSVALPVKYAQLALEQLFHGLNPDIDFSSRTSIHVHLDVRGLTMTQLLTLMFVYATVENLLFKFVGANRRNNIFCTPITETQFFRHLDIQKKENMMGCLQTIWQKYSALNVLPISTFGTVEFRQMLGTSNVTKLCIWLDLLSRIKVFAYKNVLTNVLNTISDLNTNSQYYHFIESIFGDLTCYLDTTSLVSDMEKPVYICKNCVAVNKFHHTVLNKINPTSSLVKLLGNSRSKVEEILSPAHYKLFQEFCNKPQHDNEIYMKIHKDILEYRRAFKSDIYASFFDFIALNPLGGF